MASGGFRDISTLSTGRRPRSQTMSTDEEDLRDVEGSNLLDEEGDYFDEDNDDNDDNDNDSDSTLKKTEKGYTGVNSRSPSPPPIEVRPLTGVKTIKLLSKATQPPRKSILKTFKTDRAKLLSRPRVVLRMFSLVTAGAVLGSAGHILFHYIDTKDKENSSGDPLWNPELSLTPTILLLCISSYIFLLDSIFSVVSFWPNGRYLTNRFLASGALLHSMISFICGLVALTLSEEKKNPKSMFWVCNTGFQKKEDIEIMDFADHCSEQRGAWVAACMCTIAHGLIIPTIVLGFWNGRTKRQKFQDAVIVRDPGYSKGNVFQRLGNFKDKFSFKK